MVDAYTHIQEKRSVQPTGKLKEAMSADRKAAEYLSLN
jgi:hypothetical protein